MNRPFLNARRAEEEKGGGNPKDNRLAQCKELPSPPYCHS